MATPRHKAHYSTLFVNCFECFQDRVSRAYLRNVRMSF
jgi:hypothetical protein